MEKNNIDQLFENLKGQFDTETPNPGHQERFLSILETRDSVNEVKTKRYWRSFAAVAASLLLCVSLAYVIKPASNANDLASVSSEMSKTQDFFTSTIANELNRIDKERTPETNSMIDDALLHLKKLENDYEMLKNDLTDSGYDKRVVYAMIVNFQNRIEVLQNVIHQIEETKKFQQTLL
ncbi:MAG TPA: hypothetical protein PKI08_03430 [Aquaticitalea sp.]|nr:hypothetical protein [Aquaticitalea sp.]